MNKKITALSIIIISFIVISIGISLAFFTSKDTVVNRFINGEIKGDIIEPEFIPPDNWNGEIYSKVVEIKNTGKNESFVRVSITPRWVDENNNPWSGDVSNKVVKLEFTNLIDVPLDNNWESGKWVKGIDEFYYYTSILPVNETTSKILASVKANVSKLEVDYPEDYEGKFLKVDVKVESVQTTADAYKSVWTVPNEFNPLFESLTKSNTN